MIKLKKNVILSVILIMMFSLMISGCANKESEPDYCIPDLSTGECRSNDADSITPPSYGPKRIDFWDYSELFLINDSIAEMDHKIEIKFADNEFDAISKYGFLVFTTEYPERVPDRYQNNIWANYISGSFLDDYDNVYSDNFFYKLQEEQQIVYDRKIFKIEELGNTEIEFEIVFNEPVELNTLKATLYSSNDDVLSSDDVIEAVLKLK